MKEFKGTPTPWVQNGKNGIHATNGRCIALTYQVEGDNDNRKEDASLIAAAPDLLEALQLLLDDPNELVFRLKAQAAINKALSINN